MSFFVEKKLYNHISINWSCHGDKYDMRKEIATQSKPLKWEKDNLENGKIEINLNKNHDF